MSYGEWKADGYPKNYVDNFKLSDEEVVERYAQYLESTQDPDTSLDAIVVGFEERGVLVQTRFGRPGAIILRQVNWADPSGDIVYPEYASTFWRFYGPSNQQMSRAVLLADRMCVGREFYITPEKGSGERKQNFASFVRERVNRFFFHSRV